MRRLILLSLACCLYCGEPHPMEGKVDVRKVGLPDDILDAFHEDDDVDLIDGSDGDDLEVSQLWQTAGSVAIVQCGRPVLTTDGSGQVPLAWQAIYKTLYKQPHVSCVAEQQVFEICFEEFALQQDCIVFLRCLRRQQEGLESNPICQSVFQGFDTQHLPDDDHHNNASGWLGQVGQQIHQGYTVLSDKITQGWQMTGELLQQLWQYVQQQGVDSWSWLIQKVGL